MSASPLARLRRVCVGSANPPKLDGVRAALRAYAPEVVVEAVPVPSGVPEQPLGFEEIAAGARQRAEAALRLAGDAGGCDLAVGYEDGLVRLPLGTGGAPEEGRAPGEAWMNVGCAAVSDGRRVSLGLSSGFAYPPQAVRPAVAERAPIGDVFDRLWRERGRAAGPEPSGRGLGNVGRLTGGVLPRAEYVRHAVLCALVSWLHPDLYPRPGAPA